MAANMVRSSGLMNSMPLLPMADCAVRPNRCSLASLMNTMFMSVSVTSNRSARLRARARTTKSADVLMATGSSMFRTSTILPGCRVHRASITRRRTSRGVEVPSLVVAFDDATTELIERLVAHGRAQPDRVGVDGAPWAASALGEGFFRQYFD